MKRLEWGPLTIRVRLGVALALALAPILILGAAQSFVSAGRDADQRRVLLIAATDRSAAVARTRMQSAEVILETVTPDIVGLGCAPRLRELIGRLPGYANLIRFDAYGRVVCAAANVGPDPGRTAASWWRQLKGGSEFAVTQAPQGAYAGQPAVITAVRETDASGGFSGALAAVVLLSSLKPDLADRSLPSGTQVALADRSGAFLIQSDPTAFNELPANVLRSSGPGSMFYKARDMEGRPRVYTASPLIGDVSVVLSAPDGGLPTWARLNPLSSVLLPIAAFFVALAAVWIVADQVAIRWLHYLDRVAAIYARGRFSVRPVQAVRGPPEIQALAASLDAMAETIVARDHSLRDSLAQKDGLMREIHHRVKNNLQVISSLLNMQQRALTDPAARAAISDTRQRIGALALIYRHLYQGPDLKRVNLREFLGELVGQVMSQDSELHPMIRTDLEADELTIDPDKLAPLALFAVEALSNARKHAFAEGGVLHVRFHVEGQQATLEIADEGCKSGMPVIGDGVGRTLMNAFARQLGGEAEIAPNESNGVTARLAFPAPGAEPTKHPLTDTPPSSGRERRGRAA